MPQVSATDAARKFSDMLDAVEHRRQSFTITRNGREIARIQPVWQPNGRAVRELFAKREPDPDADDMWKTIQETRALLTDEPHTWDD